MNIKTILLIIFFIIAFGILSCDDETHEGFWSGYNYLPYYGYGYGYGYGYDHNYPYYDRGYVPWYRRSFYPSYWWNSIWY